MTPTHDELNRAMAEARGYNVGQDFVSEGLWCLFAPNGGLVKGSRCSLSQAEAWEKAPNYCHDRNLLPDVLAMVEAAGEDATFEFGEAIRNSTSDLPRYEFAILKLPMRTIVEAALRACGKWKPEWEGGEG